MLCILLVFFIVGNDLKQSNWNLTTPHNMISRCSNCPARPGEHDTSFVIEPVETLESAAHKQRRLNVQRLMGQNVLLGLIWMHVYLL